jgi:hypothetical protein
MQKISNSSGVGIFKYSTLKERHDVRFVDLAPGSPDDALKCLITTSSLIDAPPYEALSYTWGDNVQTHRILIEKCWLPISSNLNSALKRLRDETKSRRLWVDALCINQSDIKEREEQVPHIHSIFKHAQMVVVYLGEETEGSELIPELFRAYGYMRRLTKLLFPEDYDEVPELGPDVDTKSIATGSPSWSSARAFFGRPWIRRTWIVQEVLAAHDLTFICGNWKLSGDVVREAVVGFLEFPPVELFGRSSSDRSMEPRVEGLHQLFRLLVMLPIKPNHSDEDLINLLFLVFETKCQDTRDLYYAILGLSKESTELALTPSYSEPWQHTYRRYAKYFVKQGHGLRILNMSSSDSSSHHKNNGSLPSWVPDLSFEGRLPLLLVRHDGMENTREYAAASLAKPIFKFLDDKRILVTGGILLDRIQRLDPHKVEKDRQHTENPHSLRGLGAEAPGQPTSSTDIQQLRMRVHDWAGDLRELIRQGANYYSVGDIDQVISCTLLCDQRHGISKTIPTLVGTENFRDDFCATALDSEATKDQLDLLRSIDHYASRYRFCVTVDGFAGQVPPSTVVGDLVFLIMGSPVPFVMRPKGSMYQLIGQGYIHGIMNGEALSQNMHLLREIHIV